MTNEFIVESGGFTFVVPKNHNFKFELLEGQQIIDVAMWSKDNPKKEFLSMGHSLWKNGRFISLGSYLWSDYKKGLLLNVWTRLGLNHQTKVGIIIYFKDIVMMKKIKAVEVVRQTFLIV